MAGESYHRKEVERLFRSWGLPEGGVTIRTAALVPEPTNKFDSDAVKVVVDGEHVGYVPGEDAHRIGWHCKRSPKGTVAGCQARLWADPSDGEWRARVTLGLSGELREGERDFAAERAVQREQQHRADVSQSAGQVRGAFWGQQKGAIAELKRQDRLDEAFALINECAEAAERVSVAVGERPDPWPAEQQSIILRKLKDPARELEALERYALACGTLGVPDKIGERLNRARVAAGVSPVQAVPVAELAPAIPSTPQEPSALPEPLDEPSPSLPPANWYPDPGDSRLLRWWDGSLWTEHTTPRV